MSNPNQTVIDSLHRAEARRKRSLKCTFGLYACKSVAKDCKDFGLPFVALDNSSALKAVSDVVPSGLNVYQVGYYHSDTGRVESLSRPVLVKGEIK